MNMSTEYRVSIISETEHGRVLKSRFSNECIEFHHFLPNAVKLKEVEKISSDLILLQADAPSGNPMRILESLQTIESFKEIIAFGKQAPVELIVKSIRLGAKDFVDCSSGADELVKLIKSRFQPRNSENRSGRDLSQARKNTRLLGDSLPIQNVHKFVDRVARHKSVTVLILGETGTGKQVVAREIHDASQVSSKGDFVEINCTALPENLFESELFGHEKGAFTDAKARKIGLFEASSNGTLFLDEIGHMALNLQAKLLKAIEEKRVRRLGGTSDINVKTRVVAGTNVNLQEAVNEGGFRQDLYYRLNVLSISLPPLREREGDVRLLAEHFLGGYRKEYDIPVFGFSKDALNVLENYRWPGNVRELKHAIERAVLLSESETLDEQAILNSLRSQNQESVARGGKPSPGNNRVIPIPKTGISLKKGEEQLIDEILKITKWNKTRAAEILGISRPRLNRKIDEYRLST